MEDRETQFFLQLADLLRQAGLGDVRDDTLTRGMYSTDASIYRIVPRVVAFPRDEAEVEAAAGRPARLIDGEMASWYGSRAVAGVRYLAALRRQLAGLE